MKEPLFIALLGLEQIYRVCGGTMQAYDLETQVEHMIVWHKAAREEAEEMARTNFVRTETKTG